MTTADIKNPDRLRARLLERRAHLLHEIQSHEDKIFIIDHELEHVDDPFWIRVFRLRNDPPMCWTCPGLNACRDRDIPVVRNCGRAAT